MEEDFLNGTINEYKEMPLRKVGESEFKYGWFLPQHDGGWVLIKKDMHEKWYYIRLGYVSESERYDSLLELLDEANIDIIRSKI